MDKKTIVDALEDMKLKVDALETSVQHQCLQTRRLIASWQDIIWNEKPEE